MRAPRLIVGPLRSACRFSVRPHEVVVRGDHARSDENLVLERGIGVMYASAWTFVSDPIVVSFSTSAPRPMTTSSPTVTALAHTRLVADDHARTDARSCKDDCSGGDDRSGSQFERRQVFLLRRRARPSVGCFPTTA